MAASAGREVSGFWERAVSQVLLPPRTHLILAQV